MSWGTPFSGQRFAVVGLGRAGLASAVALAAMGADVVAWDDKDAARDAAVAAGIAVAQPDWTVTDALALSPGIPHRLPRPHPMAEAAIAHGVPVWTDAELLFRAVRATGSEARFAGITGTNGKSTTTALLAHILTQAGIPNEAGANLGTPALALPLLGDNGVYVLEMSSYMLDRLASLRFAAAAMLNLSADHLDRHGDMGGYAAAKAHVFDRQTGADLAVVGIDDAWSQAMAQRLASGPAKLVRISQHDTPTARGRALPGAHNAQNIAAATALARALGADDAAINRGIESFPGLPHRQEIVTVRNGIPWINDSKATNADSTAWALACHDRIIWIAGGTAKEGGIESLAPYFPRIAHALLIGRDAPMLAATLAGQDVPHSVAGTLENAVTTARGMTGDCVLLSPACASWDQFTGFDQRGDRFRALAQALPGEAV